MKATVIIVLEGNPITLSDGSILPPRVVKAEQSLSSSGGSLAAFRDRYYDDIPESVYPSSQEIFESLPLLEERAVREAEAEILKKANTNTTTNIEVKNGEEKKT